MKKIKEKLIPLSLILVLIMINTIYACLNNPLRGVHSLVTDLDRSIPFLSGFVIPYVIWYPFMMITFFYLCFYEKDAYYKVIVSIGAGMLISYIIYFLFQTTVPRPEVTGSGIIPSLLRIVYYTDNPYNCFPSIHVLTSYVIIKGVGKSNASNIYKFMTCLIAVMIILSTQFIKQHVIMDLFLAVLLGEGIYKIVDHFISTGGFLWTRKLSWLWTMKRKLET